MIFKYFPELADFRSYGFKLLWDNEKEIEKQKLISIIQRAPNIRQ